MLSHKSNVNPIEARKASHGSVSSRYTRIRQRKGEQCAADLAPIIAEIRAAGANSLAAITEGLKARKIQTPRDGLNWKAAQVSRLISLS
jgi:hypothetical protein